MKNDLGNRMKDQYESRTRHKLMRRCPTIIRLDGKAFHTYTRGLNKPYDLDFVRDMQQAAIYLCEEIQGVKCAYVQSDEISLLLTDYTTINTQAWFDYNIQKICSVSASYATAKFNQLRLFRDYLYQIDLENQKLAQFDSRVFQIADHEEVVNYFIWRQHDAIRNSIQMLARSLYSHKELEYKSSNELQELCFQKGVNWNNYHSNLKRGSYISKEYDPVTGFNWNIFGVTPEFTKNREIILDLLKVEDE